MKPAAHPYERKLRDLRPALALQASERSDLQLRPALSLSLSLSLTLFLVSFSTLSLARSLSRSLCAYRARAEIHQFARMGLRSSVHSAACSASGAPDEVIQSAGGDPAVCSHGVEMLYGACNALGASDEVMQSVGGDPAACAHRDEQFTSLRGLASARRRSTSLL